MLSKKQWFIPIAFYCANEGSDYSELDGLPFQLTLDGQVSLVNSCDVVFGENIDLALLQNKKELILDPELKNAIEYLSAIPPTWLEYNLKNIIYLISKKFDEFNINMEWIEELSKFIYKHKDEIHNVKTMLSEMKIVLLEDKTWGRLNNDVANYSPILIDDKDIKSIPILEAIGFNLVNHEYLSVYKPLAEKKLISHLSSNSLSKYLLSIEDYSFLEDQEVREFILEKLTENIFWYDQLNQKKKNKLNMIPFIHTVSDNVYSLEDAKLFISTSFTPPKHIAGLKSDYDLIDTTNPKHLELYKKMGIQEQTPETYIREVIIPFLENSQDQKGCLVVLRWLSSEWKRISLTLDVEALHILKYLLRKSNILPTQDENKKNFNEIYDPIFFDDLPECLRDTKYQVISFEDYDERVLWRQFLEDLGLKKSIMPEHIIYKVNKIVSNNVGVEAYESSMKESICLANYVVHNIDRIDNLKYLDKPLLEALKQYAWLPAQHPKRFLIKPDENYSPLIKAHKLVRSSDAKIASGEYFILTDLINFKNSTSEFSARDIARKLGIVTDIPDNMVFDNFRKLIKYGLDNPEETEDTLLEYAKEFYAFLGRKHKLTTNEIPSDILRQSIRIQKKWIPVHRVFKRKYNLRGVYSWYLFIGEEDNRSTTDIEKGLELLGVKDKPDSLLVLELLNELPTNKILSKEDLSQAKTLLKEIQLLDELDDTDFPLLTSENKLVSWEDVYINDLPAYDDAENKNTDIDFCHEKFLKLANMLGVDSLTTCHEPKLNQEETIFDNSKDSYSDEIEQYIKHKYFKEALLRLLYNENKITADEINEDTLVGILALKIKSAKKLVVDYYVYGGFLFSDEDITAFEDKSDKTLYILEQDDSEDMIESIVKFISGLFALTQDSTFIIQRIIREQMDQNAIKAHLNKKHIKALPKELDIDDESIFNGGEIPYDKSDSSEEVINTDETNKDKMEDINQELEDKETLEGKDDSTLDEEDSEKDSVDIDSSIQSTTSEISKSRDTRNKNRDDIKENRSNSKTSTNISPPITPRDPTDLDLDTILGALDSITDSANDETGKEIAPPTTPRNSIDKDSETNRTTANSSGGSSNNKNNKNGFENNTNNNKNIPSSNSRMPVYVGKDNEEHDEEQSKERQRIAKERGDKGENLIVDRADLKISKDNIIEKASQNNPGFDLVEKAPNGDIVRYIEVKTLSGEWREGGVSLTPVQLKYAMNHQEKWWLFVVEGLELDNTVVHRLKNPVVEANKFMFDAGWKELAICPNTIQETTLETEVPKEGEIYLVNENGKNMKYEITKVKTTKVLTVIYAKKEGENSAKLVKLDENWEKYSA